MPRLRPAPVKRPIWPWIGGGAAVAALGYVVYRATRPQPTPASRPPTTGTPTAGTQPTTSATQPTPPVLAPPYEKPEPSAPPPPPAIVKPPIQSSWWANVQPTVTVQPTPPAPSPSGPMWGAVTPTVTLQPTLLRPVFTPAPTTPAPAPTSESALAAATLAAHNRVRAAVGVAPLRWSPALAAVAQDWADQLCARGGGLAHRPNGRYGENLYGQRGGGAATIDAAVAAWEGERRYYNPATGACDGGTCGHYTQLVWRGTTDVGCAVARCGDATVWVCNYDPPGNYVGQKAY